MVVKVDWLWGVQYGVCNIDLRTTEGIHIGSQDYGMSGAVCCYNNNTGDVEINIFS